MTTGRKIEPIYALQQPKRSLVARLSRWGRRIAAMSAALSLTCLTPAIGAVGGQFAEVEQIPVSAVTDWSSVVQLDPEARRGFVISTLSDSSIAVQRFNLDTLRSEQSSTVERFSARPDPPHFGFISAAAGGHLAIVDGEGWVHMIDQETLIERAVYPPPFATFQGVTSPDRLSAMTAIRRTPVPGSVISLALVPAAPQGWDLVLATQDMQAGVWVHRWSAASGQERWSPPARTSACSTGVPEGAFMRRRSAGLAVVAAPGGSELILGCVNRSSIGEVWKFPVTPVGALGPGIQAGTVFNGGDLLIAGRRAYSLTSGSQQAIVGVDLDRHGVIGQVGLSFKFEAWVGAGVDPTNGRVYGLSAPTRDEVFASGKYNPGGIVLVDGYRAPLPQGVAFTEEAGEAGDMIAVDPARDGKPARIFVRRCHPEGIVVSCRQSLEPHLRVYEDRVPVVKDEAFTDNDRFTVNIPEQAGKTLAQFSATGAGYGVRAILLGGTDALPDPVTYTSGGSLTKDTLTAFARLGCGRTHREFVFARVQPTTSLSDTGSTAVAAPAEADPRSIQDFDAPMAPCAPKFPPGVHRAGIGNGPWPWEESVPGSGQSFDEEVGPAFPFPAAVCLPPEHREVETRGGAFYSRDGASSAELDRWRASVSCPENGRKVTAWAAAGNSGVGGDDKGMGGVSFQGAFVHTELSRIADGGVLVSTTSEVTGIDVGGVLHIGKVTSVASSTARGLKESAGGVFTATVCGLSVPGSPGSSSPGCQDARSPEFAARIEQLNQEVLRRRSFEIKLPTADIDLLRGTPGGSLASVQKDRFTSVGERVENNDFSTAVPAIEIVKTHASGVSVGRQIFQFAAVQGSTSYNISLIPTGSGFGPDGEDPGELPPSAPPSSMGIPPEGLSPVAPVDDDDGGFPTPGDVLQAIVSTLRFILRHPLAALGVAALIFAAFGLPLHLLERRRALLAGLTRAS